MPQKACLNYTRRERVCSDFWVGTLAYTLGDYCKEAVKLTPFNLFKKLVITFVEKIYYVLHRKMYRISKEP